MKKQWFYNGFAEGQTKHNGFTLVFDWGITKKAMVLQWFCSLSNETGFTLVVLRAQRESTGFTLVLLRVQRKTTVS